jgi:hypothetical protein
MFVFIRCVLSLTANVYPNFLWSSLTWNEFSKEHKLVSSPFCTYFFLFNSKTADGYLKVLDACLHDLFSLDKPSSLCTEL